MMRMIWSKFWIPKLRNLVKVTINSCRVCVVYRKKLQTQLMGDLPVERSTFTRPFTQTYTGRACLITKGYLSTLLSKIEACLNSRLISPLSENSADLLALSPGHFLVGGPLVSISEPKESAASFLNSWQRLKALNLQFYFRWKEEYFKELQKRNKWQHPTRNLQNGDMVVVKEGNLPSNEWRKGESKPRIYARIIHLPIDSNATIP
ncbi:uncharacterized protein LOC135434548 [Drosophila montana]|uniref:uncharacterized protein LOC135434548 n=1 Tax=Drosophila montana TaxID=40370 RepID=UPI00313ED5DD